MLFVSGKLNSCCFLYFVVSIFLLGSYNNIPPWNFNAETTMAWIFCIKSLYPPKLYYIAIFGGTLNMSLGKKSADTKL